MAGPITPRTNIKPTLDVYHVNPRARLSSARGSAVNSRSPPPLRAGEMVEICCREAGKTHRRPVKKSISVADVDFKAVLSDQHNCQVNMQILDDPFTDEADTDDCRSKASSALEQCTINQALQTRQATGFKPIFNSIKEVDSGITSLETPADRIATSDAENRKRSGSPDLITTPFPSPTAGCFDHSPASAASKIDGLFHPSWPQRHLMTHIAALNAQTRADHRFIFLCNAGKLSNTTLMPPSSRHNPAELAVFQELFKRAQDIFPANAAVFVGNLDASYTDLELTKLLIQHLGQSDLYLTISIQRTYTPHVVKPHAIVQFSVSLGVNVEVDATSPDLLQHIKHVADIMQNGCQYTIGTRTARIELTTANRSVIVARPDFTVPSIQEVYGVLGHCGMIESTGWTPGHHGGATVRFATYGGYLNALRALRSNFEMPLRLMSIF